jgi:hypothetical protein
MSTVKEELPTGLTLEPDYIQVPGQNFALVSFVGPEFCRQKSGKFAMKLRGVFATEDEAKVYVKRIQRSGDNVVDIFLLSMYNWVPIPPDPMAIENQEYQETFLNDLMQGYAESQRSAKEIFADRKSKIMRDGLDAHLLPEERIPTPKEPLPPPEKMPKLNAHLADGAGTSADGAGMSADGAGTSGDNIVDAVFESEDVWMKNKGKAPASHHQFKKKLTNE